MKYILLLLFPICSSAQNIPNMKLENAHGYKTLKLGKSSAQLPGYAKKLGKIEHRTFYIITSGDLLKLGSITFDQITLSYFQDQLAIITLETDVNNGETAYALLKDAYGNPKYIRGNNAMWDGINVELVIQVDKIKDKVSIVYMDHILNKLVETANNEDNNNAVEELSK